MASAARRQLPRLSALASLTCLMLGGLALGGLTPTAALAYYPCNGPGPGEVLIGVDNTNGVQTPLCEYVGEDGEDEGGGGGYSTPDPGGYWAERFAAVAWGDDARGNATYAWYMDAASFDDAERGAVEACIGAGLQNCRAASSVANGSLAVASGNDGILYADFGEDSGRAKRNALTLCKASSKGCRIEEMLESPPVWIGN